MSDISTTSVYVNLYSGMWSFVLLCIVFSYVLLFLIIISLKFVYLLAIIGIHKIKNRLIQLRSICLGLFYALSIGGSSLVVGVMPLYFELLCDCIYPVSEGTTSAVLNLTQNLAGVLFILVTLIHGIGKYIYTEQKRKVSFWWCNLFSVLV